MYDARLKKDALREAFDYQVSILDIYCERMMGYEEDCLLNAILVDARVLAFKVDRQTGNKDCSAIVIAKVRKHIYNHIVMTNFIKIAFHVWMVVRRLMHCAIDGICTGEGIWNCVLTGCIL